MPATGGWPQHARTSHDKGWVTPASAAFTIYPLVTRDADSHRYRKDQQARRHELAALLDQLLADCRLPLRVDLRRVTGHGLRWRPPAHLHATARGPRHTYPKASPLRESPTTRHMNRANDTPPHQRNLTQPTSAAHTITRAPSSASWESAAEPAQQAPVIAGIAVCNDDRNPGARCQDPDQIASSRGLIQQHWTSSDPRGPSNGQRPPPKTADRAEPTASVQRSSIPGTRAGGACRRSASTSSHAQLLRHPDLRHARRPHARPSVASGKFSPSPCRRRTYGADRTAPIRLLPIRGNAHAARAPVLYAGPIPHRRIDTSPADTPRACRRSVTGRSATVAPAWPATSERDAGQRAMRTAIAKATGRQRSETPPRACWRRSTARHTRWSARVRCGELASAPRRITRQ